MIRFFFTRQFLGFAAVGALAAFLHWLARIVFSKWMPFSFAVVAAYAVGMAVAFALNSLYVFPQSKKPINKQAIDFIIINLAFLPVVWIVAVFFESVFRTYGFIKYPQATAHAIAVVVPAFATFLFYKFFAFKDASHGRK